MEIMSSPVFPVRKLMSLIRLLTATEKQVHLGRLHIRPIQWHLKNNWRVPDNGNDHPHSKITSPTSRMVAGGKQCYHRSTITPSKTCSANLYRRIKRRVGRSLEREHGKGKLVTSRKQTAHNYLELKAVLLALKEFQAVCTNNILLIATDNTTVIAYINKEGGMKSGPLCALLWRILTWCTRNAVTLKARHIPGRLNVIADKLSRLG